MYDENERELNDIEFFVVHATALALGTRPFDTLGLKIALQAVSNSAFGTVQGEIKRQLEEGLILWRLETTRETL
jgi:hypothetical protein